MAAMLPPVDRRCRRSSRACPPPLAAVCAVALVLATLTAAGAAPISVTVRRPDVLLRVRSDKSSRRLGGLRGVACRCQTGGQPPRLFIVLSSQRSGSTLLRTLIGAHPEAVCPGELLLATDTSAYNVTRSHHVNWPAQRAVIERFYADAAALPGARVVGFKHMYSFTHPSIRPQLVQWLADHHVAVIHLVRLNRLAQFLSFETARSRGIFHHYVNASTAYKDLMLHRPSSEPFNRSRFWITPDATAPPLKALHVSWERFAATAHELDESAAWFRDALQTAWPAVPYLELTYEAFVRPDKRPDLLRDVYTFLGIQDTSFRPPSLDGGMGRISHARTCAHRVSNWDEIRPKLAQAFPMSLRLCEAPL